MSMTFLALALANSMFDGSCTINRRVLSANGVRGLVARGVKLYCNPTYEEEPVIDALADRYGIEVTIPQVVSLHSGDSVIVVEIHNLPPMLAENHEYPEETIDKATFLFVEYSVN